MIEQFRVEATHTPITRLRDFSVGDKVTLPNDPRSYTILSVRDDKRVELSHKVTAADCHECERAK